MMGSRLVMFKALSSGASAEEIPDATGAKTAETPEAIGFRIETAGCKADETPKPADSSPTDTSEAIGCKIAVSGGSGDTVIVGSGPSDGNDRTGTCSSNVGNASVWRDEAVGAGIGGTTITGRFVILERTGVNPVMTVVIFWRVPKSPGRFSCRRSTTAAEVKLPQMSPPITPILKSCILKRCCRVMGE